MAMDFKTFNSIVSVVTDSRYPVMIRGKHGMGKSETVYQFAKAKGMPVIERRLSQMTEGDLLGLPSVDGNKTSWNPPDWFKEACDTPVVLFLDEVDRAITEVKQGIMQLTDSRTLNGHKLHPDTLIFAACNGGTHGAQYTVNDLDPAELDRWTVFDLEPSAEDFLDYANGKINPVLWDYLNQNRAHLEHKGEFEPNKVYPSRRSWFRVNAALDGAKLLEADKLKPSSQKAYLIAQGFVGFEAAVALKDFMDKYERQVTVEDILDGKLEKTKGFKLNDYISLVDKVIAANVLSPNMPQQQMMNVAKFYFGLPAEPAMKFYTEINSDKNKLQFVLAFHKIAVDGKTVKDYIIETMTAGKKKA
jgi:midasin (ATPase involved in ribosome maturation)